ncbi:MAG TPA: hypothetical protein VMR18_01010 [Candidatus Saccharimonadales bacterium]|nr:hypothetical protein [Candidatus Saccharimonadales bacterium]
MSSEGGDGHDSDASDAQREFAAASSTEVGYIEAMSRTAGVTLAPQPQAIICCVTMGNTQMRYCHAYGTDDRNQVGR